MTRKQEIGREGEQWLRSEARRRGWEVLDANLANPNNPGFDATLAFGGQQLRVQIKSTDNNAGKRSYREWSFKPQQIPYPYVLVDLTDSVTYSIVFDASVIDEYIDRTVTEFMERNPKPGRTREMLMNNVCHVRVLRPTADVSRLTRTCLREDDGYALDGLFDRLRPS